MFQKWDARKDVVAGKILKLIIKNRSDVIKLGGKGFKFMHLNIGHLQPKQDQLHHFLYKNSKCILGVCGISETFLNI